MSDYPVRRELCGVFFRVERDGRWQNVCFSDMTNEEREDVMARDTRSVEDKVTFWQGMATIMADRLHEIGDEFGISCTYGEEE